MLRQGAGDGVWLSPRSRSGRRDLRRAGGVYWRLYRHGPGTIVDREEGIPALGTMAHSWVQLFDTEEEAFRRYAQTYPSDCTLLVDTYNVLESGIPNAIKIFNEVIVPLGFRPKGVRIDSGDIAYLSKKARAMLDEAGFHDCGIVASNSLDEYIISDLLRRARRSIRLAWASA